MTASTTMVAGPVNHVPPSVQQELYQLVVGLDGTYHFPHGQDVYWHLLNTLNQHFKTL